jgi:hypothetical protein
MIQSDEFFAIDKNKEFFSAELFPDRGDFLKIFGLEVLSIKGLQIPYAEVPLLDRNAIIFGDTVQKVENGMILHFLS